MDIKTYTDIIRDVKNINNLHVNDTYFNVLSKKYPSIPEETLRSIISLWFQRKVTQIASRVKDVKIYDLYRNLIMAGTKDACWQIAHQLEYPPSLIAKIVLTSYLAEMKKKNTVKTSELKKLRKQQCPYCKSLSISTISREVVQNKESACISTSTIKKHHDPRVELALNLFDDDDEVGKYFLEKFTFSNNKTKKNLIDNKFERSKSNKFFWQASSFEEMGEENVKKFSNVENLFKDRLSSDTNAARIFGGSKSLNTPNSDVTRNLEEERLEYNKALPMSNEKLLDCNFNDESNEEATSAGNQEKNVKTDELTMSNGCDTFLKLAVNNDTRSTFDELRSNSKDGGDLKICTCGSQSTSDDSDTDSENSNGAYENFNAKEIFENPSLIDDPTLARDVFYCISFDDQYGPTSDVICSSSGITHEKLLEDCVKNVGLAYKTENRLREDGFDKTPDIILLVPVAVNNFVINWVESKAQFVDYKLHQDFEKRQFQNYVNRFGPGLVIYWHGYVNEILKSDLVDKHIIISDRFPLKESFTFVKSNKFKLWMQSDGEN